MKRIMMIFGAISMMGFLSLVAGLGFLGTQAISTSDQNKTSAIEAVREISQDWTVEGRGEIVSSSLIRVASSAQGRRAFKIFSRLGSLVTTDKVSQTHFGMSTTKGTTATVEFVGTFTNGSAKITVKLRKHGGIMKIVGFKTTETKLKKSRPAVSA
ncbi:MAG: hypothetical protein ACI89J_000257 [Hyphomicrobiaceae bacterium]|jgi:hypothetical protein